MITSIGSSACRNALERKLQLKPGVSELPYACWIGNQPAFSPRKYTATSEVKNAGNAPSDISVGTTMLSTSPPRRQAAIIPIVIPRANASTNATPTRKIEYGSVRPITSVTFAG